MNDFFGASSSSSYVTDVTQTQDTEDRSRTRTVSGSSAQSAASMDTLTPISRSSSMMSLGSEPEDSRPASQASDQGHSQMDSVIMPGCIISSGDLQTINDKMATMTNFFKLSKVTKASTVPDTSSKVQGKTIKIYNLKAKCKKCMSEVSFVSNTTCNLVSHYKRKVL
jgi:hypothetical protein